MSYVGQRVLRVEDPRYLRGRGLYVDDVELPGLGHVAFVRSPLPHARIVEIDASRALAQPGVVAVVTGADLEGVVEPLVTDLGIDGARATARHPLPQRKVRFVGEAVAAVVGESRYLAEDAVELVRVEWEELTAVSDALEALAPGAPLLDESLGTNVVARVEFDTGDVDEAFVRAHRVFSKRFSGGRVSAAPLEGRGVVASWDSARRHLTVWSASQVPFTLRTVLLEALDLAGATVRVISPDVGGGFGAKGHIAVEELVVPAIARMLGRPVKWIEDRYENLSSNSHSKEMAIELELAVGPEGEFLALRAHYVGDGGAYSIFPYSALIDPLTAAKCLPSIYTVRSVRFEVDAVLTNKCPTGSYRGVGRTTGQTALESLIDDAARGLEIDPLELRLRNAIPHREPYTSCTGLPYDGGSYVDSIRKARELAGYEEFRERQRRLREQGRYVGIGFSPFVEQTAWGSAMARATGLRFEYYDAAAVTVEPTGAVTVRTGQHSHGQGHDTTFAQLVADELAVPLEDVRVLQGDTDSAAYGMGTFASRGAVIGGGSLILAAGEVREKLLTIAGHLLEAAPADLELRDGRVAVKGSPSRSLTVRELAHAAYFGRSALPRDLDPTLAGTRSYDPPETFGNGTIAAVVEVDGETGAVEVRRVVAVEDCGTILNPMVLDGQVAGGIAQGIGVALLERLVYGDDGQLATANLMDYLVPSATDVPPIEVSHLVTPSPRTLGGIKGAGEAGTQAAPAAVANAVADALAPFGVTISETPIDPAAIVSAIRGGTS
jgi:carbon-monoxide dehydrogenase large subunit